jgi:outer membrane murein-binding lipoprotein Lpp
MSESIIVAIISSGVSLTGIIVGFVANYYSNKKKFEKLATNDMKHMELDPNGPTAKKIDGLVTDVQTLKIDVQALKTGVQTLNTEMKGVKSYNAELNGILKDKKILTNEQTARLNNILDKS